LLDALLTHLKIEKPDAHSKGKKSQAYLKEFPPYISPESPHDPQYKLRPEEVGKTPLELLRTALLRIIAHVQLDPPGPSETVDPKHTPFSKRQEELLENIKLVAATRESVDLVFSDWIKTLDDDHYWEIQTRAYMPLKTERGETEVPLYAIGFWNLLSDYLSYDAISKIRDLGTFYHLLPENPNAAEWVVWWLRGFGSAERLRGVCGGMECIIDELVNKLEKFKRNGSLCRTGHLVTEIRKDNSRLKLLFEQGGESDSKFDRVILALPKCALEKIVYKNKGPFESEKEIYGLLDSAFPFAMLKLFVVVKDRWWQQENRANWYATRVPTRELHYWKGLTKDSRQGMIMLYTDRPNSSFWSNYVLPGSQNDAYRSEPKEGTPEEDTSLPPILEQRLMSKVVQYINENDLPNITAEDIVWYGIRDWAREPYGGANHAWRPERKYWVVMSRLGEISVTGTELPSIHVCGEAYSDYHGFMEGSLRSAVYSLHRILDDKGEPQTWLNWLEDSGIAVKENYLKALKRWAGNLDNEHGQDRKFLYKGVEDESGKGEQGPITPSTETGSQNRLFSAGLTGRPRAGSLKMSSRKSTTAPAAKKRLNRKVTG
jgi:hypothetical protein